MSLSKPFLRRCMVLAACGFGFLHETLAQAPGNLNDVPLPVVVYGQALPAFLGKPVASIRLYRYQAVTGQWEPIPFQFDEMDGTGSFEGMKNGTLDATDELAFLNTGLGDSASAGEWVEDPEARGNVRTRIQVQDPARAGTFGFVYGFISTALPKSDLQPVRYFPVQDRVETDTYAISHSSVHGFQDSVLLKTSAGGDGIDFMDRQKLRFKIKIAQIDKEITLKEQMNEDVELFTGISIHVIVRKKRVVAKADPVVRLLRDLVMEISADGNVLGQKIGFADSLRFHTLYTPTAASFFSGRMAVPDPDQYDAREIRLSADYTATGGGMRFFNASNPGGFRIDGIADNPNKTLFWPGRNDYLIVADPLEPRSAIKNTSVVGAWEFRGGPVGDSYSLYFKDYALTDYGDTGDKKSFGDAGFQTSGAKLSGILDVESFCHYLPFNTTFPEAQAFLDRSGSRPTPVVTEERRLGSLAVFVEPPGTGTVTIGPWNVPYADSTVTLMAVPTEGYEFSGWEGDVSGIGNPATLLLDGPKTATARFKRLIRVALDTDPPGHLFSADGRTYASSQVFIWAEGGSHALSVDSLQDDGFKTRYRFSGWSDGGARVHTFTVPAQDAAVTARFTTQFFATTLVIPRKTGRVVPAPPGAWFDAGTPATLEAFPNPGLSFLQWSMDLSGNRNPETLVVDGPKTVKAHFGNLPPVLAWPDTSFAEDDTLNIPFVLVDRWIEDPDNADTSLAFGISAGEWVGVDVDSIGSRIRLFTRVPDWSGQDSIRVDVADPSGAAVILRAAVLVLPSPDAPRVFVLTDPADGTAVSTWPASFRFAWEPSFEPDPGDTVTYQFQLDTTATFGSNRCIQISKIRETHVTLDWPLSYGDDRYYWAVTALDKTHRLVWCERIFTLELATGIDGSRDSRIPTAFVLDQNFPNPFNAATEISFGVPVQSRALLQVFDGRGRLVRTVADRSFTPGFHTVYWDGKDIRGTSLPTGIYIIRFTAGRFQAVRKTMLLQ